MNASLFNIAELIEHQNVQDLSKVIQQQTIADQQLTFANLLQMIADQQKTIADLQKTIATKNEIIAHLQRLHFGKKSEKVIYDPSCMLPGMAEYLELQAKEEQEAKKDEETKKTHVGEHDRSKGQKHAGWNGFPEDLEREEKIIDVPEKDRQGLKFVRYEINERLLHRCAYIVQVVKRPIYVKPETPENGVVMAPLPAVPSCIAEDTDRCHYDVSVVVHVIAEKLVNHNPFYRQSQAFARIGIEFGRSTMCMYFVKVSKALKSLYDAMVKEVLACEILHADETRVPMLVSKHGKTKICWIWVRKTGFGPPLTVFHFSQDRSSETAKKLLGDYYGTIISDRYAAYEDLPADSAGCWAHCRRKFFDAQENHPKYAARALELVRRLYLYEKNAKEAAEKMSSETELFKQRKRFRVESAPVVKEYFALCDEIQKNVPHGEAIEKAAAYSIKQKEELSRFLSNPKLNIDNNPCENVIRPFCIGRKNWLFVGNDNGGTSMAVLASFAATCKDNKINFEEWLADILVKLDTCPAEDINTLLPHNWKATH